MKEQPTCCAKSFCSSKSVREMSCWIFQSFSFVSSGSLITTATTNRLAEHRKGRQRKTHRSVRHDRHCKIFHHECQYHGRVGTILRRISFQNDPMEGTGRTNGLYLDLRSEVGLSLILFPPERHCLPWTSTKLISVHVFRDGSLNVPWIYCQSHPVADGNDANHCFVWMRSEPWMTFYGLPDPQRFEFQRGVWHKAGKMTLMNDRFE